LSIHDAAARGFERGALDYEKGRPSYPSGVIDTLRSSCGLGPSCDVVDVGAGTGKFTRLLEAAGPASVVAVEPVDGMRAELVAKSPGVRAVSGMADATGLDDGCADLVTVAQAFHWFATDSSVRELARLLRPGGFLALVWNTRDLSVAWEAAIDTIMTRLAGDAPRFRVADPSWQLPIERSGAFGPLESARFPNPVPGVGVDIIRARVASTSYVSALPEDEREAVLAEVEEILRRAAVVDDDGAGLFADEYLTDLFWCRRLAD
jgi:SAM-dependent methyltransferase